MGSATCAVENCVGIGVAPLGIDVEEGPTQKSFSTAHLTLCPFFSFHRLTPMARHVDSA